MGLTFDKHLRIAGYKPAMFKAGLRGFMRTHSPGCMIDLKTVFPQRRDGAIVFEECLERGLIEDQDGLKLSGAGDAMARGKAKPRTVLAKAQVILNEFLQRVDALNGDHDAVRYVDEVWLFGSVLRNAESVGDIDLALVSNRRPQFSGKEGYQAMEDHLEELLARRDDVPEVRGLLWSAESWLTEKALYGPKRHLLLAGVQDGTGDLADLAVPCRLIYDRSRGGRVDDKVLDRHPASKGRRNDIEPPAEMPDLTPRQLRPMDARWICGFQPWGTVSPYEIFRGWTDEAHKLFPRYPDNLFVAGDDFKPHSVPWLPKHLIKGGLDGRAAVVFCNANEFWGTSVILRRRMDITDASWTLVAGFEDLELFRRRRIEPMSVSDIASAAALVLAVDAEHMLRRSAEIKSEPMIRLEMRCERSSSERLVCESVTDLLKRRLLRVEPLGWTGSRVAIELLTKASPL